MSLVCEEERIELLEQCDVFFMAKLIQEENVQMEPLSTETFPGESFLVCLLYLQEKYPYFKIRPSKNQDNLCIITVSLPHKLKTFYREAKAGFVNCFENAEVYYGESFVYQHYNELHVQIQSTIFFHDILCEFIEKLKALHKMEG